MRADRRARLQRRRRRSDEGRVRLVYPEIQGGRVIADVEVAGLGDYFVGERTRVYVADGERARRSSSRAPMSIAGRRSISSG